MILTELADAADTKSLRSVRLRSSFSISQEAKKEHEETLELIEDNMSSRSSTSDCSVIQAQKDGCWKSTFDILFPRENTQGKKQKAKLFHFELLRDPAFLLFCLSLGMYTATFKSTFIFMPALAEASGLTASQAVLILSIAGGVDTPFRILAGFLLDRPFFRKRRLVFYCCVEFLLAGVCALMPLMAGSFVWLCVLCSLFSMMTGVLASQRSVVCVDLLDVERMPSAFGILLLIQAVGVGSGPILSGMRACLACFEMLSGDLTRLSTWAPV
ncbi:monocarboxylate transporter 4 [Elysia marginata]|uniref:Monocarboxylate transporter 4 n=1 Tax=Elysia marginata TaxID=1093978 RepID=A0AAV4FV01_9GAST|nr:monocarboxylate transporter 4 [Elysia marginata]